MDDKEIRTPDQTEIHPKRQYDKELIAIIKGNYTDEQLKEKLEGYHDNDIASALCDLTAEERKHLYKALGVEAVSDIFAYLDDVDEYIEELPNDKAADIIESMDADDAVDVLDELDEDKKREIIGLMDKESAEDVNLINRYKDDEIGSLMTTNYIDIVKTLSVKQAMDSLVAQADKNDNISTIYVTDSDGKFYGAIELRDLFIARAQTPLEDIISTSYPYLYANEKTSESLVEIKEYAEDSLPVLDADDKLIGVITSSDVVEAVDDAIGEDYAKLAGLTEEEDLTEPLKKSMLKRIPWLIILLGLSMVISAVIGAFENVIVALPLIVFFQSIVLDMSGNIGTQSLGVTVRLLSEDTDKKTRARFLSREMRVSFINGLILGIIAFIVLGLYLMAFKGQTADSSFSTSLCIGLSLVFSMVMAGLAGTCVPMIFKALKIDPAVASGPLITTINDLVSAVTYYGFAWLFLILIPSL